MPCCGGMGDNYFKHALYIHLVIVQEHVIGINEISYMDVGSNLNPRITLQCLTMNQFDTVIKEGGESVHPYGSLDRISEVI